MVYEDELEQMPAGVWYRFYDGGHNGIHFVMRDEDDNFYHLDGAFGSYELSCPNWMATIPTPTTPSGWPTKRLASYKRSLPTNDRNDGGQAKRLTNAAITSYPEGRGTNS